MIETRNPRSSVAKATTTGGRIATVGKINFLAKGERAAIVDDESVMIVSKLFRKVMAMIGKFVDSVKTGNKAKK